MEPTATATATAPAAPAGAQTARPDAILYPFGWDPGGKARDRESRIYDYLEATLGAKPVWINDSRYHQQPDGSHWKFAFPQRDDTYTHPTGHPRAKSDRYDWADQPNGVRFGTLKPDAWKAGPGNKPQRPPEGEEFPAFNPGAAVEGGAGPKATEARTVDAAALSRWRELTSKAGRTEAEDAELGTLDVEIFTTPA